jgi:hypothetical protein
MESASMTELLPASPGSNSTPQSASEFDLLRALARAELSSERIVRVVGWDLAALDWAEFVRLAAHHGVLPLVTRNLIAHRGDLPVEMERSLRASYDENLRHSLWFAAELGRIVRHFESRRLQVVPYKGPVLAQSAYGDPGMRSFSDLDLLISPANFEPGKQALAEIGYRPSESIPSAVERLWLRTGYERSFDGAAAKNLVELQWALLPRFYGIDFDIRGLLARADRVVVGGCEMSCLSPEDSLLALCLHGAKHLWTRLIWLADISETLRKPSIDHTLLVARARAAGILRILGISFWLARNVLDAELPRLAEEVVVGDPQVPVLGGVFAERLARDVAYDFESTEYFRLVWKLRERRSDRWRYLSRLVWTPGAGDVAAVELPEALFPLYRAVRLGRLTRKLL